MYFYNAKERDPKEIVPGGVIRTFWGDNTLLSLVDIAPTVEVPLHTHPHEQSGIVLEGELEMGVEGEVKLLSPETCTSFLAALSTTPRRFLPALKFWIFSAPLEKITSTEIRLGGWE